MVVLQRELLDLLVVLLSVLLIAIRVLLRDGPLAPHNQFSNVCLVLVSCSRKVQLWLKSTFLEVVYIKLNLWKLKL